MGKITHGMTKTRIYSIWKNMKKRCSYKPHKNYKNYGGRGITVCNRWLNSFENFYEDMGEGYNKHFKNNNGDTTIDRKDNNGNYNKNNCSWITISKQQKNRIDNIYITYKGKTQIISEWSKELGINKHTLGWRLKQKWTAEKILTK